MVLGRLWNFVKRHRRKFAIVGVATGAYFTYQYLKKKWLEIERDEVVKATVESHRQKYLEATLHNCDDTIKTMLPQIHQDLNELIDTDSLTTRLKSSDTPSDEKMELWQEVKIFSFARALTSLYTSCLLAAMVRVQLSVLAGYLFIRSCPNWEADTGSPPAEISQLSDEVKAQYMAALYDALKETMRSMAERMTEKCREVIGPVSLKERLTLRRLDSLIHEIRLNFEADLSCLKPRLAPSGSGSGLTDEMMLDRLVRETREIFTSAELTGVLKACSDGLFSALLDHFAEHFQKEYKSSADTPKNGKVELSDTEPGARNGINGGNGVSRSCVYDIRLPLAKLVPVVNAVANQVLVDNGSSPFLDCLLDSQVLRCFTRNVYDSFSSPTPMTFD